MYDHPTLSCFLKFAFESGVVVACVFCNQSFCSVCAAVGRFSGEKLSNGQRNFDKSCASDVENLYFSINNRSIAQFLSLLIRFRSPCLSKKSFDRAPPIAIYRAGQSTFNFQTIV